MNELTLAKAHEGLVAKEFTSQELTQSCLNRIKEVDGNIHAFLSVFEESALKQARTVDDRIARGEEIGMLEGIPVAIKDNLMVAGAPTTAGSKILEHYIASYDATVIQKLKDAGAILLGKTNLDEFAMGSSTENSAFGPTKNPWDTTRVPGGSSGGSAAAVAADECIYALGSDTGGSIRLPASLCGVVGLKPTYGTVSRSGLIAMASSLDQVGPFAKTVSDAAVVFDTIKGVDPLDASSAQSGRSASAVASLGEGIKGLRIGVPKEYFIEGMDPDVEKAVRDALDVLRDMGAEIISIELPHTEYALAVYYILMPAEVSANLSRFDGIRYGHSTKEAQSLVETYMLSRQQGFGAEPRRRLMLGTYVLAAGYHDAYYNQAQKVRMLVRQDFDSAFQKVDCIVAPTSPTPAFRIGEKTADPLTMYLGDIFTVSANIAGIPGVSMPCGFAQREDKSLPIGLQILGRHFDEATIMRVAHAFEQATEWHTRKVTL